MSIYPGQVAKPPGARTAAELLAELNESPAFQRQQEQRMARWEGSLAADALILQAVVDRLRDAGCDVNSLDAVDPLTAPPERAVPILTAALRGFGPKDTSVVGQVADAIMRCSPGPSGAAELLTEFARRVDGDEEPVRWTLGNKIEMHVGAPNEDALVKLIQADVYSTSRGALIPAAGRLGTPAARNAIIAALADDDLVEIAIDVIGRAQIREACQQMSVLAHAHPLKRIRTAAYAAQNRLRCG